ncbi:MAG: hypothetical protein HY748_06605 [Elusimicrobia bacterium]|nr:hypothetical protein [Elusimicrobiota bacterium]
MTGNARLLLLEFFPGALCRNEKTFFFPFLNGLAKRAGFRTLWLCFGGDLKAAGDPAADRTIRAVLPERDLRTLAARLARFRPTRIVSSDLLPAAARRLVDALSPKPPFLVMPMPKEAGTSVKPAGAEMRAHAGVLSADPRHPRFLAKCGWFLDWLGARSRRCLSLRDRYLVEAVDPDYGAVLANPEALRSKAHITIMSGVLCSDRSALKDNPLYAGIGPEHENHRGCAFCGCCLEPAFSPPGADLPAVVARQFRAILRTGRGRGRDKGIYEFYDIGAFRRFDRVFKVILRLGVPPGVFLFNPRIDDVLAARPRIERVLPALAKAGHEVRILSMGVENFSARENRRFNKGITAAQVDELIALTRKWEKAFPGVFKPFKGGGDLPEFGIILYTPWTTLEDLRINISAALERGFAQTGYWLYSALLIYPDSPIAALARREGGIFVDRHPDRGVLYGAFQNDEDVLDVRPWRFKAPGVADFFAVMVRVSAAAMDGDDCAFFKDDPEFHALKRIYAEAVERARATPLAVACKLLEALEDHREVRRRGRGRRRREALLRSAVARLEAGRKPDSFARLHAPASAAARAVEKLFRSLSKRPGSAFSGVDLGAVTERALPAGNAIRIAFSVGGRGLVFDLLDARTPGPCFLVSRRFKAVLSPATPSSDPRERRVSEMLLDEIDRRVDRAA